MGCCRPPSSRVLLEVRWLVLAGIGGATMSEMPRGLARLCSLVSVICWGSSQGLSAAAVRSGEMSSSMGLWCSARVDTPELGCFIRDGMLGRRG